MSAIALYSWVGVMDYNHAFGEATGSPLVAVTEKVCPDRLVLFWADGQKTPAAKGENFKAWLRGQIAKKHQPPEIQLMVVEDADEHLMDFAWIYGKVEEVLRQRTEGDVVMINASSGTWIMSAAWVVYAKAVGGTNPKLYITSKEHGVQELRLPPALKIDLRRVLALSDDDPLVKRYLRGELWANSPVMTSLIGNSSVMNRVRYQAEAVAQFRVSVLIVGGPGTGKSLLAEVIHKLSRESKEFVLVDCGQLHTNTEINAVFGWTKGAFTDAKADNPGLISQAEGGTLFLDEVGNAPASVQISLLRFLQTGKYRRLGSKIEKQSNARIIAATNVDLDEAVRQQRFRQELLDRLRAVLIRIPPLRERDDDIVSLTHLKLVEFQQNQEDAIRTIGAKAKRLTAEAEEVLRQHDWPGNVRELEQLVARLVIFGDPEKAEITGDDVRKQLLANTKDQGGNVLDRKMDSNFHLDDIVRQVQWHYVHRAAKEANRNKTGMAQQLGFGKSRTPLNTLLHSFAQAGMPDPIDFPA